MSLPASLLVRVFGCHDIFVKVLSMLPVRDMASLQLALPEINPFWVKQIYQKLISRHGHLSDIRISLDHISFKDYVRLAHLLLHSRNNRLIPFDDSLILNTDLYHHIAMVPSTREFLVQCCLFLPLTAPGCFANNLVILTENGYVLLFSPEKHAFRLTARFNLRCQCHSIAVSPLGSVILLAHADSMLIKLDSDGVGRMYRTSVWICEKTFLRDCFVSETQFLTASYEDDIMIHEMKSGFGTHTNMQTRYFFKSTDYGKAEQPFGYSRSMEFAFMYKRKTFMTDQALLVMEMPELRGFGNRLRVIYLPQTSKLNSYYQFVLSIICSVSLHPDHTKAFIVVMTKLSKAEFFNNLYMRAKRYSSPNDDDEGQELNFNEECFTDIVSGYIGVYELDFMNGNCLPRFYLSGLTTDDYHDDDSTTEDSDDEEVANLMRRDRHRLYNIRSSKRRIYSECSMFGLVIKLDADFYAHLPFCTTADSAIVYQETPQLNYTWAISEYATFQVFFQGFKYSVADMTEKKMKGTRICSDLDFYLDSPDINKKHNLVAKNFNSITFV